jgi:tetratricopeptide (TPR) repeat protein
MAMQRQKGRRTPARGGWWAGAIASAAALAAIAGTGGCTSAGADAMTIEEYRALEPERRREAASLLEDGNELLAEEKNEAAARKLADSLRVYDRIAAAWNNLGVALLRQGEFVEADDAFSRAASLDPTDYRPLFNRGLMYFEKGFLRESRGFFERAIAADDAQLAPLWYAIRVDIALDRETEQTLDYVERAMKLERNPAFLQKLRLERLRIEGLLEQEEGAIGRRVEPSEIERVAPDLDPKAMDRLGNDTPAER